MAEDPHAQTDHHDRVVFYRSSLGAVWTFMET